MAKEKTFIELKQSNNEASFKVKKHEWDNTFHVRNMDLKMWAKKAYIDEESWIKRGTSWFNPTKYYGVRDVTSDKLLGWLPADLDKRGNWKYKPGAYVKNFFID